MRNIAIILVLLFSLVSAQAEELELSVSKQLIQLLGKSKDDAGVIAFCKSNKLNEFTKGESGGFMGDLKTVSFSLLYRNSSISRVGMRIGNPPNYAPNADWAIFKGELPYGLLATDTPDDVIAKLGNPSHRPEPSYLSYDKPKITISFHRGTKLMSEINIDAP